MKTDNRKHGRTAFPAHVELAHASFGSLQATMRNLSDGGAFVETGQRIDLPLGTEVSVQAQGTGAEAPVVQARIVRVEKDGLALRFLSG